MTSLDTISEDLETVEPITRKIEEKYYMPLVAGSYQPGIDGISGVEAGLILPNKVLNYTTDKLRLFSPKKILEITERYDELPNWYLKEHKKVELTGKFEGEDIERWINERSGILKRTIASPDETVDVMAVESIKRLIEKLEGMISLDRQKIGLIVHNCTIAEAPKDEHDVLLNTPEEQEITPHFHTDQNKIDEQRLQISEDTNITVLPSYNNACAGGAGMIDKAIEAMEKNSNLEGVICVASEKLSDLIRKDDVMTTPLLSDAAGAYLVTKKQVHGKALEILGTSSRLDNDKNSREILRVSDKDIESDDPTKREKKSKVFMDGPAVFKKAVRLMGGTVKDLAKFLEVEPKDIKEIWAHQANERILEQIERMYGIYLQKFMENGNCSAATIPRLLNELEEKGLIKKLKKDEIIAIVGFGMGLYTNTAMGKVIDNTNLEKIDEPVITNLKNIDSDSLPRQINNSKSSISDMTDEKFDNLVITSKGISAHPTVFDMTDAKFEKLIDESINQD